MRIPGVLRTSGIGIQIAQIIRFIITLAYTQYKQFVKR